MDPKRLRSVPLFEGLARKDLQKLGAWTDEVEVPAGRNLARQGEFAYEFFVIEDGTADVSRDGRQVATLGPGDFFGEIGLIRAGVRTASVVATSPMRLIVMGPREFSAMESEMPHVANHIAMKVKERVVADLGG